MRGDSVEVLADWGAKGLHRYVITTTRAGRRLEVTAGSGVVEVREVMRTGRVVWTLRFPAERVVHILESDGSADSSAMFEIDCVRVPAESAGLQDEAAADDASAVVTSEAVAPGVPPIAARPPVPALTAASAGPLRDNGSSKGLGRQGKTNKGKRGSPRKRPGGRKR
ncbi:hypothetical protein [Actinomadura atramentaria]|uniref:hypothetical protein n=1 Tax=Actinomadura atramentaria TaxID=1990 RepID=UPI000370251B|nr:hypothetical protein [Actinomadura atramentaria]